MELSSLLAVILVITGAFFYINHRFVKFPMTVGVMALATGTSLILLLIQFFNLDERLFGMSFLSYSKHLLSSFNYSKTVIDGFLCFLLFAGALDMPFSQMRSQKLEISFLATISVFLSTLIFGWLFWLSSELIFTSPLPFLVCLLLGAVVSPTDPIAVLAMLRKAKTPPMLQAKIAGESLFNDGVGIVVVLLVLSLMPGSTGVKSTPLQLFEHTAIQFLWEVFGAIIYGLILGHFFRRLVNSLDEYKIKIFLSIAFVYGGYTLANNLGFSGPISIVVFGLYTGNIVTKLAMNEKTREHLNKFWVLIDDFLNAMVFTLLGFELLSVDLAEGHLYAGIAAILVGLIARFISVLIPVWMFTQTSGLSKVRTVGILTWGGLRGALSIALAFLLPDTIPYRSEIIFCAYMIVTFSILVQALTMERFVLKRL